jgi:pyruvate dehydrogenase E1 component
LQHQDGHSHLIATTVPNCVSYDPGLAYELAVIIAHGMHSMLVQQEDVFFYITTMNENHAQPSLPEVTIPKEGMAQTAALPGAQPALQQQRHTNIMRGAHALPLSANTNKPLANCVLLGSGAILHEVLAAAQLLASDWQVQAQVISVTSYCELTRQAQRLEQSPRAASRTTPPTPFITELLLPTAGPLVAATDYVRAVPEQIRAWVPPGRRYVTLGTDGFGRSDSREQLRAYFGVGRHDIVLAALQALVLDGALPASKLQQARSRYKTQT